MIKIAPSILAADFSRLGEEIKAAEKAGADIIHLDIMDGHFVPNLSFGEAVSTMSKSVCSLPHDAHLMVTDPENHIDAFARIPIDYITFPIEIEGEKKDLGKNRWVYMAEIVKNDYKIYSLISKIRKLGSKAGLAVNPPTKIDIVLPFLRDIDLLLLMSVNPGFAGQAFMPEVFDKIKTAAGYRKDNNLNFEIMIDGGVGLENAPELISAGADILVTGSSFYRSGNYSEFIRKLKS